MIAVASDIEIPASPSRVWNALIDFPSYQKWNSEVAIRGVAGLGNKIEWSFGSAPVERRMWATAIITEFDEPRVIAWTLGIRGLFAIEERFSLESIPQGTRLRHEAICRGLFSKISGGRIRRMLGPRLSGINARLYQYLSSSSGTKAPTGGTGKRDRANNRRQVRRRAR